MSIEAVLKKEHKKLSEDLKETQRLLEVIEKTMMEYGMQVYDTSIVSEAIMDCLKSHNSHATFDEIYAYLEKKDLHMHRHKLSPILQNNHKIAFNRMNDTWEIVDNPFRNAA